MCYSNSNTKDTLNYTYVFLRELHIYPNLTLSIKGLPTLKDTPRYCCPLFIWFFNLNWHLVVCAALWSILLLASAITFLKYSNELFPSSFSFSYHFLWTLWSDPNRNCLIITLWCPKSDKCVLSLTSDIYWVEPGFINNYKELQL